MRRVVLVITVIWLPLLTVAQTLVPLPPACPVRPGDSWGVISGVLTAEDGTPVVDTVLTAGVYRWDAVNNVPLCAPCVWGRTDEHGAFRIRVQPGRYHLWMMGTNSVRGYASQFYGGAIVPRASGVIEVKAGQDRAVDFRLTMRAGSTIAGRILWPESAQSIASGEVPAVSLLDESRRNLMTRILGVVQNEWQFEIRNVRPGKYVVRAQKGDDWAKAGNFLVEQEVQVDDGDVTDLDLPLHLVAPAELSGTVVLENGTSPGPLGITLSRNGSDIPFGSTISNVDGTFVLKGLLPGHYSIMVMPDPRSPRVAPDDQGRVYPYRGVSRARRKHVLLVSAYLGDKDVMNEGFHFDGIVIGTLRLAVRLPPE